MLKPNNSTIGTKSLDNKISGAVKINAGSFIIDNQWVSYNSYLFRVNDYISSVLTPRRTSFFINRGYAIYLLVCLDIKGGIKVLEGSQVRYTNRESVPPPSSFTDIPLAGVILRQDGTNNLNTGYVPITDKDVKYFSGTGNIIDKNLVGITGLKNDIRGLTGYPGNRGVRGHIGAGGQDGDQGLTGYPGIGIMGGTGIQGMTGISWDVHLPLTEFNI